jgi:hypothetical protein
VHDPFWNFAKVALVVLKPFEILSKSVSVLNFIVFIYSFNTPYTGDTNRRKVRLFQTLQVTISSWKMAGGSHKFGSQVAFVTDY